VFVAVNGVRLFVAVQGAGLVPDGDGVREKPALLLLLGGPGSDHSGFKRRFSRLCDMAQVIDVDQRGNGRSEDGDRAD
jgi:pimeloyl-ACP methyl ester carboxylesterase